MTAFENMPHDEQAALEAAAEWWVRIRAEPAAGQSEEFQHWIAVPLHAEALNAVKKAMGVMDEVGAAPRVLDMRRSVLGQLRNSRESTLVRRRPRALAAAALLLVALGAGSFAYYRMVSTLQYVTSIGERRVIALADGSTISLDSDSAVDVRLTKTFRSITLDRGRARFDVAHDTKRPFTVNAGDKTVVAVGTSFNVERLGPKVIVTLIEGRVLVKDETRPNSASVLRLAPGQQMDAEGIKSPAVRPVNLETAVAWEAGHLVFRGESLGEAVERINRYTEAPIMVAPSAASIPISGVFNAGDVSAFVGAITSYFPVDATTNPNGNITLQRRSS